jgi:hypothetical protein
MQNKEGRSVECLGIWVVAYGQISLRQETKYWMMHQLHVIPNLMFYKQIREITNFSLRYKISVWRYTNLM